MDVSQDKLIDALSQMTALQISELVKTLEEKWGVSAAAPAQVAVAQAGADAGAQEEKTEFDVVLKGVNAGAKALDVVKVIRTVMKDLSIIEAKKMVDASANEPASVLQGVSKDDAEAARKTLADAGANVEVK